MQGLGIRDGYSGWMPTEHATKLIDKSVAKVVCMYCVVNMCVCVCVCVVCANTSSLQWRSAVCSIRASSCLSLFHPPTPTPPNMISYNCHVTVEQAHKLIFLMTGPYLCSYEYSSTTSSAFIPPS